MKLERHSKIVELIGKYEIETQEELAERLKQAGYKVTQATVSRDIRELKLKGRVCIYGYGAEYPCDQDCVRHGHGCCCGTGRDPFS